MAKISYSFCGRYCLQIAANIFFCLFFTYSCLFANEPVHPVERPNASQTEKLFEAIEAYEKGYKSYRSGDFNGALKYFQEALKLEPNFIKVHYWLGKLYREMGRLREADFHWQEVLRLQKLVKERREALSIKNNEYPALQQLTATRKRAEEAETAFQLGKHLLEEGHWSGAIAAIQKAVELYPAEIEYQKLLARLLWDRNNYQSSAKIYTDILNFHKNLDRDLIDEATERITAAGWHREAARFLKEALKRFPQDTELLVRLADVEEIEPTKPTAVGHVLDRSKGIAVLDLGLESGLSLADEYNLKLRTFRPGNNIIDSKTGRTIGRRPDTTTGELLVTKVFAKSCWALIKSEYDGGVKAGDLIEFKSIDR